MFSAVSGRVGIGAADPAAKFEIRDSSGPITGIRIRNDNAGGQERIDFSEGDVNTTGIFMFNSSFPNSPNVMRFANNRTGGDFDWVANGQPKLTLFNDGNLLVGNSFGAGAATTRLDVDGQIRIRGGSPGVGKVLTSDGDGVGSWAEPGSLAVDDGDWTVAGSDLYSAVSGDVGIGVASPLGKLHVRSGVSGAVPFPADGLVIENQVNPAISILAGSNTVGRVAFFDPVGAIGRIHAIRSSNRLVLSAEAGTLLLQGTDEIIMTTDHYFPSRLLIDSSGNVGINDSTPGFRLDVNGTLRSTGAAAFDTTVNIGNDTTGQAGLNVAVTTNVQGVAVFNRTGDDGTLLRFRRGAFTQGTIDVSGGTVSYNAFTGSHYGWTDEPMERGMLASLTGENRSLEDVPGAELVYGVRPTRKANDPAVLGAYLAVQNPAVPASTANPQLVMAVGNGDMWVVDDGEDIAIGDYLISSAVPGHAMRDRGRFETTYVVARAAEPVRWNEVDDVVGAPDGRLRKHTRMSIFFESFVIHRPTPAAVPTVGAGAGVSVRDASAVRIRQAGAIERLEAELAATRAAVAELRALVHELLGERGGAAALAGQE